MESFQKQEKRMGLPIVAYTKNTKRFAALFDMTIHHLADTLSARLCSFFSFSLSTVEYQRGLLEQPPSPRLYSSFLYL